ncbi:MAG: endonuclease/exonuclease/phosphatase family protein [Phocaeicola plebeius]|nr:endonuclease/exonuclease/phosphatase family protein [Phocaeicola plebeius]
MKKWTFLVAPLLAVACSGGQQAASMDEPIDVMSFNVRYDNPGDSLNNWRFRKDRVANAIRFYDAEIVGTQEVLHGQLLDLQQRLPEYGVVGVGREDGKEKGEYSALWYKKDRFEVIDSGNFWLSETPEVAGSKGWDGACERIAAWARLKDKTTGKVILALNTHLDHVGEVARREGVALVLDRAEALGEGARIVVTGDFNAGPESEVIRQVTDTAQPKHLTDARTVSPIVYGPDWTFHDFGRWPQEKRERIDYVFLGEGWKVTRYGVLAELDNEAYLSDHNPVLVTIQ